MKMNFNALYCVCVAVVLSPIQLQAQPADTDAYQPLINAPRITGDGPVIDGSLDDRVWADAAVIEDFWQVDPEYSAPSQKTRAYIMYDQYNLYVGVYMYDDEPDKIQRSLMERDPPLRDDDAIRVLLDPFGTSRDSYFFGVNPNGARSDALTENGNQFRNQWDTIWTAKAKVVEDGWVAEFAIPFRSISFDTSLDQWGFQIIRTVRRNNEEIRWSNLNRARGRIDMSNVGGLAGIRDVSSGLGLEAQLFVTGGVSRDHELQETDLILEPSANFFYKITPSLTGSLTFNTDFADAPLDSRQVNTGRFSLFFPETRDFFLQDSASFEFAGGSFLRAPNGLPFFSRRIGIVDGAPVDIIAGAKVSGKAGPINMGLITTRTGSRDDIDGQTLSAARFAIDVLEESKAGVIVTNGDPTGETKNTVAGADFQYRNSTLIGEGLTTVNFAYLRSLTDGEQGSYGGVRSLYEGDRWRGGVRFDHVGENYSPKLGFTNRTGINRYRGSARRRWRPDDSFIRRIDAGGFVNVFTDLGGDVLDRFVGGFANAENDAGDRAGIEYRNGYLNIREPFDIAGELPVVADEYNFNEYEFFVETSEARVVSFGAGFEWGGAFGGDFYEVGASIALRPSRFFRLEGDYGFTQFDLPGGKLGIHIASIENTIAFTPDMTLKTDFQYDNISESFSVFSRFSWEPKPTQEVFLAFGHGALIEREDFPRNYRSQGSSISLRLGHTFRL